MEYTTNYQLPVWAESDRILRTDFNDMTSAIDAALDGLREDVDGNTAAHAGFGNCQLYTATYVGTDTTSVTHTFPKLPRLVAVIGNSRIILAIYGATDGVYQNSNGMCVGLSVSWSGNTVTWTERSAYEVCNAAGITYQLLALLEA